MGLAARLLRLGVVLGGLAPSLGIAAAPDPPERDDDPDAPVENVREVSHRVQVKVVERDAAIFTVTRTFTARSPGRAVRFERQIGIPDDAVVTSFQFRSGPEWRQGRLELSPGDGALPAPAGDAKGRPGAILTWSSPQNLWILTPTFRTRGSVQVRYTIWARGAPTRGVRRWVYCNDDPSDPDQPGRIGAEVAIAPDRSVPPGAVPSARLYTDGDSCTVLESAEPPLPTPSARFGVYRLGKKAWWWRVELTAPASLVPAPPPPEPGPVVFVLDASRSQVRRGGLAPQLAVVRAYLTHAPHAQVELILTNRTATRAFGRLIPAADFEAALSGGVAAGPLRNGSFLEHGVALAAGVLLAAARPGRIVVMTDGQLRSRFDQAAASAALGRAPPGTLVHMVDAWPSTGGDDVDHVEPEGLHALAAPSGGASYSISIGTKPEPHSPSLRERLLRLMVPDRIESISLRDLSSPAGREWPDFIGSPLVFADEVMAGETHAWSAVSTSPPPARLSLRGWVWGRPVNLPLVSDRHQATLLPRLATADGQLMRCESLSWHRRRALAAGFLAPGLAFHVPGAGRLEASAVHGIDGHLCERSSSGGSVAAPAPKPDGLPAEVWRAIERCGLAVSQTGSIRVDLETQGQEILDVIAEGGAPEDRGCVEEALWGVALPDRFNERTWQRVPHRLALSRRPRR